MSQPEKFTARRFGHVAKDVARAPGKRWVPISGYGYTVAEVSAMQEAMACGCVAGESGGCVLCGAPTRWPLPEYASAEERVEKERARDARRGRQFAAAARMAGHR